MGRVQISLIAGQKRWARVQVRLRGPCVLLTRTVRARMLDNMKVWVG